MADTTTKGSIKLPFRFHFFMLIWSGTNYIKSTDTSVSMELGFICFNRKFSRQNTSYTFINLWYVWEFNSVAISRFLLRLSISSFQAKSKEESEMVSQIQSIVIRCGVAFLCLFCKYFHGSCSNELYSMLHQLQAFKHTIGY